MFQQLPINENRQQQSYALIAQNKAIDSKFNLSFLCNIQKVIQKCITVSSVYKQYDRFIGMAKLLFTITEYTTKSLKLQYNLFRGNIQDKNTKMYLPSGVTSTMDKG